MSGNTSSGITPGVDIEEVERIRRIYNKMGMKFLNRVFTDSEIEYCTGKSAAASHLTGRFAAKEAVIKILKTDKSPSLKSIEIIHGENGAPLVVLHNEAKEAAESRGIKKIEITISHTRTYAVAFALGFSD